MTLMGARKESDRWRRASGYNGAMRYSLPTLVILVAIGPPVLGRSVADHRRCESSRGRGGRLESDRFQSDSRSCFYHGQSGER